MFHTNDCCTHLFIAAQQAEASKKRGIPLIFTPGLKMRDVLWALRPLLLDRGLVTADTKGGERKVRKLLESLELQS